MLNNYNNVFGFYSIKMDEIALKPNCRYNNQTNEIVGFCWNHRNTINSFKFESHLSINQIQRKFKANEIHLANDALCVTIGKISSTNIVPKPIIVIPLCSHTLFEINEIVYSIKEIFHEFNPSGHLLNVATDGDHFRRKMLNSVREPSSNLFWSTLRFFDDHLLYGTLGINFDIKHLIKRIRGIIISDKRMIKTYYGRVTILTKSMRYLECCVVKLKAMFI